MLKASLLLPTFNRAEHFARTLAGLARQSEPAFEVLVCDDGSDGRIAELAERYRARIPGLSHLWQPDEGFRKCRILNEGILRAESDYLLFLDADCVPHHDFVREHLRWREPGYYLSGRRVELGGAFTRSLTEEAIARGRLDNPAWLLLRSVRRPVRRLEEGILLPHWLAGSPRRQTSLLGCNFSCWREDLVSVNGFEESFVTPAGGEDTDVERRLLLNGVCPRSVRNRAICFHQWHPELTERGLSHHLCAELARAGSLRSRVGLAEHESAVS